MRTAAVFVAVFVLFTCAAPVRCAIDPSALAQDLFAALNARLEGQLQYSDVSNILAAGNLYESPVGVDVLGHDVVGTVAGRIARLVEGKEAALRKLVETLESAWEKAFVGDNLDEAMICSIFVDRDGPAPPQLESHPNYGHPMDMEASSVTWAPEVDQNDDGARLSACVSAQLDSAFKQTLLVDPSIKFQHFGAAAGFWRAFPGHLCVPQSLTGECAAYDPRKRPWYASAASGPKSVVLVLDTSGSMSQNNRIQLMKDAAKAVLTTLTNDDFFNIVKFASTADPLMDCNEQVQKGLVRATPLYKQHAIAAIDALSAGGNTNYEAGFSLAFDIINQGREFDQQAQCRTAILFLTDGERTHGDDPNIVAKERNTNDISAHIFTYALGKEASGATELKQLACDHKGSYTEIEDGGDLVTKMASFFQILAVGIDSDAIVWSAPYFDSTGLVTDSNGLMITLSQPVYDKQTHKNFQGLDGRDYKVLLGVIGLDVMMSELAALLKPLTGLRSYGFLVSRAGATFAHPRLRPQADAIPDTLFLDIAMVDTSNTADEAAFVNSVRPGLVSGAKGSTSLQISRYVPRGSGSSMERLPPTTTTYFWAPASDRFSVGLALDPSDEKAFQLKESRNASVTSYYHRLSRYPSSMLANISVRSMFGQDVSDDSMLYFLAHRAYTNPYAASQVVETTRFVLHMHEFMNDQSNVVQNKFLFDGGGIRDSVRPTVQLGSQQIEPLWRSTTPDPDLMFRCWSTLDTGYISCYPGVANLDSLYDPVVRPFFERALAFVDQYAITVPFMNAWVPPTRPLSDRVIVSIYRTFYAPTQKHVRGVVGVDYSFTAFRKLIESAGNCSLSDCTGNTCCLLIDNGGFVISDPAMDMGGTGVWAETQVHMRDGSSYMQDIWNRMNTEGMITTDLHDDFGAKRRCTSDQIVANAGSFQVDLQCSPSAQAATVYITALPATNAFVLAIENWQVNCNERLNSLSAATETCLAIEFDACKPPPDYPRFDLAPCSTFEASDELLDLIRSEAGSARCGLWWWEWLLIAVFAIWLPAFGCSFCCLLYYYDKHFDHSPSKWVQCCFVCACCFPGIGCLALGIALFVRRLASNRDTGNENNVETAASSSDESHIEMTKGRLNSASRSTSSSSTLSSEIVSSESSESSESESE